MTEPQTGGPADPQPSDQDSRVLKMLVQMASREMSAPEEDDTGLRRFFDRNANLLRTLALMFSAAAFLRATPKDDGTAVMMFLLLTIGAVTYTRLWEDLPRRLVVLPGNDWTLGLTIVYYCMTILMVIAIAELAGGFTQQRAQYLPHLLGTIFAITGAATLTYRTSERKLVGMLAGVIGRRVGQQAASVLMAVALVLVILGAYALAFAISPQINAALDIIFGPGAPMPPAQR